jgi:hypothetical protein
LLDAFTSKMTNDQTVYAVRSSAMAVGWDCADPGEEGSFMATNTIALSLAELGNVPPAYRHEWRVATPKAPLILPNAVFKWHHVHREGVVVPEVMDADARAIVADAMADGAWDPSYGLNVALLHVSTEHAFLIAGVWRGHQELWARHYVKELAGDGPFTRIDPSGHDAPPACVWELGVICHERMAWSRYLFSDRTDAAKRA